VFAEGQAAVVADQVGSIIRGDIATTTYDGHGMCYLEFGEDQVARVDVTFLRGQAPFGDMDGPSEAFAADKVDFGSSRIQRWFGRAWSTDVQNA
jgi:sulfide:quinone oxidoreductase